LNFSFKDKIKAAFKPSKQDGYGTKLSNNLAAGGFAGALSLCFVYSLDYALANDTKSANKGGIGERQFNGLVDVYKKTMASDGIAGVIPRISHIMCRDCCLPKLLFFYSMTQ